MQDASRSSTRFTKEKCDYKTIGCSVATSFLRSHVSDDFVLRGIEKSL